MLQRIRLPSRHTTGCHCRNRSGDIITGGRFSYLGRQYTSPTALPSQDPFGYLSPYGIANFTVDWKGIMGSSVDGQFFHQ